MTELNDFRKLPQAICGSTYFAHHHDANLYCLNKLMETYARFWVHMHDVVTLDLKGKTTKGFIHTMMSTYQLWIFNIKVMKYNPSISLVIDIINF